MPINEFRNRIRINKYLFSQNAIGGNEKSLASHYDLWAKKEPMNGSRILSNLEITYSKAFKITTRYERSRPIIPIDEIFDYNDNLTYSIQSVTHIEEGKNSFNVMIAYTNDTENNNTSP